MKKNWKTLIVDDEKLARERLKLLLSEYGSFFSIASEASNADDAATKIEELKPDIVFLDIQMPGANVFEMLAGLEFKPLIVFCTAFDQYALEAFKTYSVDYLLKPVEKERLELTVKKLEKFKDVNLDNLYRRFENITMPTPAPVSIAHKLGNKIVPVKLDDVVYFEARDKYVNFYNMHGDEYLTDQTLVMLSQKLPHNFVRISKSAIINRNYVLELQKYFRGRFVFVMNNQTRGKLISGQVFNADIKRVFDL